MERFKKDTFHFRSVDEEIQKLESECSWGEIKYYQIKYFILDKRFLGVKDDLKKYYRSELEKIKICVLELKIMCEECDVDFTYNEEYGHFNFIAKDTKKKNKQKNFLKKLEDFLSKMNCSEREMTESNKIIDTLNEYLK